ncbi:hypothetical protein LTR15_011766 [Elasticomyces elasticus]|nr:hypothetical protein LTR15_011766 [Elasticomyces elasticus]
MTFSLRAFAALLALPFTYSALLNFDNCLAPAIVNSNPQQLQWIPLALDAKFSRERPYTLNLTIYGNVSGQQVVGDYPPPNDPSWSNENNTFGKIEAIGSSGNYSTLLADFKTLQFSAWDAQARQFCPTVLNASCPLGPAFGANDTDPSTLPAFSIQHDFGSAYTFASLASTIRVISGDVGAPDLACVSANITPDLGSTIKNLITWLPATILIVKGLATLAAAIWSPWGSTDIFRWSSNYGRDEDQLRLVTPGFGDCLQYIQFVTLTGALSLQYPGFYQPAVSQTSWSLLLFNESYVSHGPGTQSLVDGVYRYNGTYGMTALSQLIGMDDIIDIWACMAIWLLVIAGLTVLLCQLGFLGRWIYRTYTRTKEQDLRAKNLPFTLGNMIRLLFNYFILPIVSLSLFQLVISPRSPTSVVVCAVLLLVTMILAAGWCLRVIFTTKPRTILFDDMPTVLLYGPLYNTYSDSAAPFALVPVFITFMRAVALGAVQPSGIGQIIVLAICEVILILTLNGFRPFQGQTSMNAYHTFFAAVRLVAVLLSTAFVPSLNVGESPKGWIGYAILLLHACVLVFGFFLNALQTLLEVVARSLGVAGDSETGAVRGSILNARMLKKRQNYSGQRGREGRGSMTSDAAILQDGGDGRSLGYGGGGGQGARSRSMSASSQQLLNRVGTGGVSVHRLSGFENLSSAAGETPGVEGEGLRSFVGGRTKSGLEKKHEEQTFYRPPRVRRTTMEMLAGAGAGTTAVGAAAGAKTRGSGGTDEFPYQDSPVVSPGRGEFEPGAGYRDSASPAPAYFRDRADSNEGVGSPRPDYAVREVDQYYRGPALSDLPTRKLKTGPADPTGPAAQAQGWFQRLMVGAKGGQKAKEPSKGFEVVRSSRMPMRNGGGPAGNGAGQGRLEEEAMEMQTSPRMAESPYRDSPPLRQGELQAGGGAARAVSPVGSSEDDGKFEGGPAVAPRPFSFGFGADGVGGGLEPERQDSGRSTAERPRSQRSLGSVSDYDRPRPSADTGSDYDRPRPSGDDDEGRMPYRISGAPSLGPIESVGGIDLPSRFGSRRSANLDDIEGNQDWLSDVNNLSWNHEGNGLPQPTHQPGPGYRSPPLPRRNSRRTPSEEYVPTARQLGRHSPVQEDYSHGDVFSGFDSAPSTSHRPNDQHEHVPNEYLTAPSGGYQLHDEEMGRPHSFASVHRHRAGDSISRNSFGANAAMQGSSAEIFGATPPARNGFGEGGRL